MSDENKPQEPNTAEALKKERAELDQYKKELMGVHDKLKGQVDLFNAMKERGIESKDDLELALLQKKTEDAKEDKVDMPTNPTTEDNSEWKQKYDEQQQVINQLVAQRQTDQLINQIRMEIKDKPEYALLEKGLNESIAYNILRAQHADKEKGLTNKPLSDYLKSAEEDLRGFFTKLGGEIKTEGEQSSGQKPQETSPQPTAGQDKSLIDFPSLPSGGSDKGSKEDPMEALKKAGTNPVTGKFSDKLAFEKDLTNFLENDSGAV